MDLATHQPALLAALRDFFLARRGEDLERAYAALARHDPGAPPQDDWLAEEYAFNRLFVGPGELQAPPFASVWLDREERCMGRATDDAREVYAALGLASPWGRAVPDDHLSLELDACLHMLAGLETLEPGPEREALEALWHRFVDGHLRAWLPAFAQRVREAAPEAPAVGHAAGALRTWLERAGHRPAPGGEVHTTKEGGCHE
jgi:TorA maturation chaperone TorD